MLLPCKMYLEEWNNKPRNGEFVLLNISGDINNPVVLNPKNKTGRAKNITNIEVTVYNDDTDRVSDKSVYIDKNGGLYLKSNRRARVYLDEFKSET